MSEFEDMTPFQRFFVTSKHKKSTARGHYLNNLLGVVGVPSHVCLAQF